MVHKGRAAFVTMEEAAKLIGAVNLGAAANGQMSAAADFMGPGVIEVNHYQSEITDMVRRRFPFGQRIDITPATGQPSRYFEQLAIATAAFSNPRVLTATASQPTRVERVLSLKALTAQINYGLFDVEVNQQQGQFAYLEAKDLTDTVDGVLKLHDSNLWQGNDTDPMLTTTTQYFGVSGQLFAAAAAGGNATLNVASTGSLVDAFKLQIATMVNRQDFEVRPTCFYSSPLFMDLFDREAKSVQLYYNQVEVIPGVVVDAVPTQAGVIPLVGDQSITVWPFASQSIYTGFFIQEDMVQYHYLTDPLPRVFQLGLLQNLAAQYVVVKFGAVIAKGATYAHSILTTTR